MNAEEIKYEEVTTGVQGYSLKCQADFKFNQVQSFNWVFNGSFIHPSINKGLTVLTNGDLSFDSILPSHAGYSFYSYYNFPTIIEGGYSCHVQLNSEVRVGDEIQLIIKEATKPTLHPVHVSLLGKFVTICL